MKVLMLGWEFPPYISGGLGTACYGLTRGLDRLGVTVLFVLPRVVEQPRSAHVRLMTVPERVRAALGKQQRAAAVTGFRLAAFEHTEFRTVDAVLQPYSTPDAGRYDPVGVRRELAGVSGGAAGLLPPASSESSAQAGQAAAATLTAARVETRFVPMTAPIGGGGQYAGDLFAEVERYSTLACLIAQDEDFDVIHAHDWMTYPAGIAVKRLTGKPLVVHIHSTEFDRSGLHVNQRVYDVERAGMHAADRVIAVSHLTQNVVTRSYSVSSRKVRVVYNAIDDNGAAESSNLPPLPPIRKEEKIVLFLGRITMQKGPEYFLQAAKRVLEFCPDTRFIMAGSGDMIRPVIEMAAAMGIGHKVLFTGFLRGDDVKRVFKMADLYVMPSVSEPFGIAPLEALAHDVPVLISKQSGVAEVLTHALKVDFWDIDEMTNKIVAVLKHPPLQSTLRDHGRMEVRRMSWSDAAEQCVSVYQEAIAGGR